MYLRAHRLTEKLADELEKSKRKNEEGEQERSRLIKEVDTLKMELATLKIINCGISGNTKTR